MTITKLEDLPNELWLELFVYFTQTQLSSTWLEWKLNHRIQMLAQTAEAHVALQMWSTSFKTYSEYLYYFEHEHVMSASRITSLTLNESVISTEIVGRWLKHGPSFFPRIRRFTIYYDLVSEYVQSKIVRLIDQNASILRHVVFYFDTFDEHSSIFKRIVKRRVSVHTMELIIVKDDEWYWVSHSSDEYITNRQQLTFPNTVRLRLSLKRISDLLLFLHHDTLPRIKHLHITLGEPSCSLDHFEKIYNDLSCFTLCPKDFISRELSLPYLRTLHLQQVSVSDIIVLIQHLPSLSQLESLILVNCNVKDKNELITLKNSIKTFLICLCRLHFVLYLPVDTELEQTDLYWFDLNHHAVDYEINEVLLLYTVPYLLNSQRQLYNHTFAHQLTVNNNINHIEWVIDNDPLSISKSLVQLKQVESLELNYNIQEMNPYPCSWSVILPFLRNVQLDFEWYPIRYKKSNDRYVTPSPHRCIIFDQLRRCAPALQCLTLWWHDVCLLLECSDLPWPSVQQLNILLRTGEKENPSSSLIERLPTNKAFPHLQYLSFGSRRILLRRPELIAELILSWFDALMSSSSELLILHVNRGCFYFRSQYLTKRNTLLMLLKQHIYLKHHHHSSAQVIINPNDEVIIWI